jgi:hypothetical protein
MIWLLVKSKQVKEEQLMHKQSAEYVDHLVYHCEQAREFCKVMNGAVSFTWVAEMITQCMINTEEVIFLATSTVKKN